MEKKSQLLGWDANQNGRGLTEGFGIVVGVMIGVVRIGGIGEGNELVVVVAREEGTDGHFEEWNDVGRIIDDEIDIEHAEVCGIGDVIFAFVAGKETPTGILRRLGFFANHDADAVAFDEDAVGSDGVHAHIAIG